MFFKSQIFSLKIQVQITEDLFQLRVTQALEGEPLMELLVNSMSQVNGDIEFGSFVPARDRLQNNFGRDFLASVLVA